MDFTIGIASRNLATLLNFVGFRDSRNFTLSEARRVTLGMITHGTMEDHHMSGVGEATQGPQACDTCHMHVWPPL